MIAKLSFCCARKSLQVEIDVGLLADALEEALDDLGFHHGRRQHLRERRLRRLQLGHRHVLVGGVRLRDVAGAEDDGVDAGAPTGSAASVQNARSTAVARARPAAARSAAMSRVANAGLSLAHLPRDRAWGDVAARTRRSASSSRSLDVGARRRPQRDRQRGARRHDVERDAAVERGDVEADALEAGRPLSRCATPDVVQRDRGAREHRDRVDDAVDARRVAARSAGAGRRGADAAVAHADAAAVGSQTIARSMPRACALSRKARMHDAAALLVAREQHADVGRAAGPARQRFEDGGDRALGVGAAEAVRAARRARQRVRRRGVAAVGRHGVDVRVQQQAWRVGAEARVDVGVRRRGGVDVGDLDRGGAQRAQIGGELVAQRTFVARSGSGCRTTPARSVDRAGSSARPSSPPELRATIFRRAGGASYSPHADVCKRGAVEVRPPSSGMAGAHSANAPRRRAASASAGARAANSRPFSAGATPRAAGIAGAITLFVRKRKTQPHHRSSP